MEELLAILRDLALDQDANTYNDRGLLSQARLQEYAERIRKVQA